MASCFFIGHRETKPEMLAYIAEAAEELIQKEWVSTFYTGGPPCVPQRRRRDMTVRFIPTAWSAFQEDMPLLKPIKR